MTPEEINALVEDDIQYWFDNPFVSRDMLAEKARYWIAKAYFVGKDRS